MSSLDDIFVQITKYCKQNLCNYDKFKNFALNLSEIYANIVYYLPFWSFIDNTLYKNARSRCHNCVFQILSKIVELY